MAVGCGGLNVELLAVRGDGAAKLQRGRGRRLALLRLRRLRLQVRVRVAQQARGHHHAALGVALHRALPVAVGLQARIARLDVPHNVA